MKSLKGQLEFDAQMDLKRFRLLLNQICEATGHEDYEAAVETLLTESRAKDAALDRAIVAIKTLPEDALGYGKSQDIAEQSWNRWPFRDELLAELEAAVQVGQKTDEKGQ